jgi:hypothetical protein
MKKFLNIKIGTDFYGLLITHPTFSNNWKAISPAYDFLTQIAGYNHMDIGSMTEFHSKRIEKIFQPYVGYGYREYIDALRDLGLLEIDEIYYNTNFTGGKIDSESDTGLPQDRGFCKSYLVTEKGLDLLYSDKTEYLKKLHTQSDVILRNQKAVSQRVKNRKMTGDYVIDHQTKVQDSLSFNYSQAMSIVSGSLYTKESQTAAVQSLVEFSTKDFTPLARNETDGRIPTAFVRMNSQLRDSFMYEKNTPRAAVLDIRACHPTFLGMYLVDYVILHTKEFDGIDPDRLKDDVEKWNAVWTSELIDPRDTVAVMIGRTKSQVKDALIKIINGHKSYTKVLNWIKSQFPEMYKTWQRTKVDQTGVNISKHFETQIMLEPELFRLSESLGLTLVYEYDGVSVFTGETGINLICKCQQIARFIVSTSERKLMIRPVIKIEFKCSKSDKQPTTTPKTIERPLLNEDELIDYQIEFSKKRYRKNWSALRHDQQTFLTNWIQCHRNELVP